ncbi:MAG: ATP-binding protein [Kiritimatiellae bacterium]|nr:ATP-binding protein [Kiritimatiellia bacterium]MDD5521673.1 ATP-binding protein [Kiritimatiellia bacterium]
MSKKKNSNQMKEPHNQLFPTEKVKSLSLMATGVAHDFNNLLAAVLGNISIILRNIPADSPLVKNATQIETTARKALDLTNQLQIYTGKGEFKIEKLYVNEMINDILPGLKKSIRPGIDIQCAVHNDIPMINGDLSCIRQVITNLVSNAADAIIKEKGTITILTGTMQSDQIHRDEECLDEIPHGNNYVYVEIKDTGCGMTSDVQAMIFDPFFTTKIRGRGLGLSVVLGILRAHGGNITINSEPGKGSTFKVMFPAAET